MQSFSGVFAKPIVTVGLLGFTHLPLLLVYFAGLANHDHYHFFPFALVALFWFGWQRVDWQDVSFSKMSRILIAIDLLLLLGSCLLNSPWLASAGFLCLVTAVSRFPLRQEHPPFELPLLFLTVVRPPVGADVQLIQALQPLTSRLSGNVLDRLEIRHVVWGNLIELPGRTLFVEDACSGVQSLFALVFVAVFIVAWHKRPPLHAVLMLITAPVCALAMNVARVAMIAAAWSEFQLDLSAGVPHEFLGYLLLLIATLLLLSADRLFACIGGPVPMSYFSQHGSTTANPFSFLWNRLWNTLPPVGRTLRPQSSRMGFQTALSVCCVALLSIQYVALRGSESQVPTIPNTLVLAAPKSLGTLELRKTETKTRSRANSLGEHSQIWHYQRDSMVCQCSFDFPFVGWHDLRACYRGLGWHILRTEMTDGEWPALTFSMSRPTGERGYVAFSMLKSDGSPLLPPTVTDPVAGLTSRLAKAGWLRPGTPTCQSQIFVVSTVPFSQQQLDEFFRMHCAARDVATKALTQRDIQNNAP